MTNTSHSLRRNKSKIGPPISAEELAGDSTMTGFSNLFRIPVQQESARSSFETPPPDNLTGSRQHDPPDTLPLPAHRNSDPNPISIETVTKYAPDNLSAENLVRSPDKLSTVAGAIRATPPPDKLSGPVYQTLDGLRVDMKCIRSFDNVQSAHTPSEHLVYTTMWKMLGTRDDDNESREGLLPMAAVANKVSISLRNLRRVLRSLEEKLALEITEYEDKTKSIPRRYRIWGFGPTIERRRKAGYYFVYRNRNLITLAKLCPPDNLSSGIPDSLSVGSTDSLAVLPPDNLMQYPPDKLSAFLIKKQNNKKTTTTLRTLLQAKLPTFDDAAVEQLWTDCRRQTPDVTAEEVSSLFQQKLASYPRGIENQNGFLMRAVARSCTAAALAILRQGRESAHDLDLAEERALYWQRRATYWETLNDPKASDQEKRVAEDALATMPEPSAAPQ